MTDYNRVLARIDALSDVPVKCVFLGVLVAYASTNDSSEEPEVADCWDDNLTRSCLAYANKLFKSILLELEFICVRKYDEIQDSDDKIQGSGDNLFVCVCGRPPARQLLEILESIHLDPIQVFSPALPKSEPLPDVRCTYRVKPATQPSDAGRGSEDGGRDRGSSKTQVDSSSGAQTTRLDDSGQPTKEIAKKWHLCSDGLLHESFGEVPEIEADRSAGLPFPRWCFEVVADDLEDAIVELIYHKVKDSKNPGFGKILKKIEAMRNDRIGDAGRLPAFRPASDCNEVGYDQPPPGETESAGSGDNTVADRSENSRNQSQQLPIIEDKDLRDYEPFSKIKEKLLPPNFLITEKQLKRFLDQTPEIRTGRPLGRSGKGNQKRLLVHRNDFSAEKDALIERMDAKRKKK